MSRTTLDIDAPILDEVRRLRAEEGTSMGAVVSELLASALAARKRSHKRDQELQWTARSMGARVDLADKDALHAALDEEREP